MNNKERFLKYLQTCVKSTRATESNPLFLGGNAPKDYVRFLESDRLFDYNPNKWVHVGSIYDINDYEKALEVFNDLIADEDFLQRDKDDNQGWRRGAISHYVCFLSAQDFFCKIKDTKPTHSSKNFLLFPLQRIFYGAPGTGKSYSVFSTIAVHSGIINKDEKLSDEQRETLEKADNIFRTTFHPDYDYAQFVGCYKPKKEDSEKLTIDYKFLLDKLSEFTNNYNQTTSAFLLGLEYRSELDRVLQAEHKTYNDLFKDAGCQSTNLPTMLTAGITANDRNRVLKSQITYSFTPQVFTNALVKSYENSDESVYLVIEEINRGNCAQIFGDIFQLLDRNANGESEYTINVDEDLKKYLEENCPAAINDGKIKLPSNFNIIATMNTSDQSLFPMDSAFKRRWEWEYVPVKYGTDVDSSKFKITIGEKTYNWHTFLEAVNAKIKDVTSSEDKQMGNFFIKGDVDAKAFCNKVMFYLWNDVSKDYYGSNDSLFQYIEEDSKPAKHFSFNELFGENQTKLLHGFMKFVKCNPIPKKESDGSDSVQSASEDSNNSQEA